MNVNHNTKCYTFKKIIYTEGFLDDSVYATYIIHLKDNGRLEHVYEQLKIYHPTKIVYIVFNEGFKICKKQNYITDTAEDLVDANIQNFRHANNNNYKNILVLEDDFIFSEKIKSDFHQHNINTFIKSNDTNPLIYYLGCVPNILLPYDYYNYTVFKGVAAHSVIYNTKMREIILNKNQDIIKDWDVELWNHLRYTYYIPLCYQLFTDTENSTNWGKESLFDLLASKMALQIYKICGMNKHAEPGYSLFYFISKINIYVIILIIILIFMKIKKLKCFKNILKKYFKK